MSLNFDPAVFAPYLPMYRHRGPPHRHFPWWFNDRPGHEYARWMRVDGEVGPLARGGDATTEIVLADQRRPLPEPAPMPTQVWVGTRGALSVVAVSATHVAYVDIGRTGIGANVQGSVSTACIDAWRDADAVLVLGPSPYGRDCPWARVERAP